ncbi:TetR/AcrR family transcriptional regulator [Pseudomonas sp. P1B16]|jgi:Transcriptional regulator|uniref:TetR/AcrR family transcriptional regulator n=1 Tax=Pseudomonas capeferrum TaxID=1495066 RepID=A0ABY7R4U9_9PSED|nr:MULTISPECIES: TetR/AcrR family transcriptional regulator [Pseudomonas]KEY89042.1 TetR family transcriptional regulator [Pseudomonas capeferrum]KGI92130.1 TetR family transcriptional regulator [Pseudomonas sp. H2]MCH7301523.1 TetR/AcrR family transcriptional regulator [Pseudomonas capeferrum]MDD2066023.1 TetR/AcrR family transcriptional regulator [Pseudomonas sp. 25571]MDD2130510.1 TetR/AcrR family transcriptional regulator [Pseudomonas sp. 17391]
MKKPANEMREHILDVARALMTHKGYTAVGLNEVLSTAGVPKGSFYHYFKSKEEFGQALLDVYFDEYLSRIEPILKQQANGAQSLLKYFQYWSETQYDEAVDNKCLVVKLGAEVCDLSEVMRHVLDKGTSRIIRLISDSIERGIADGSIVTKDSKALAESLYQLWLGASLMAKVNRSTQPFQSALAMTKSLLG